MHIAETIAHEVATRLLPWIHEAWQSDPQTYRDIVKVVADEYRDRLDQLEAENAKLRRQVELAIRVHGKIPQLEYIEQSKESIWICGFCGESVPVGNDPSNIIHHPDCQNAEEST